MPFLVDDFKEYGGIIAENAFADVQGGRREGLDEVIGIKDGAVGKRGDGERQVGVELGYGLLDYFHPCPVPQAHAWLFHHRHGIGVEVKQGIVKCDYIHITQWMSTR